MHISFNSDESWLEIWQQDEGNDDENDNDIKDRLKGDDWDDDEVEYDEDDDNE